MKHVFFALIGICGSVIAAPTAIPFSPFQIECPDGFTVDHGTFSSDREFDPNKGIRSSSGHIHLYRRIASNLDDAIHKTESIYRELETQRSHPMPFLLDTQEYSTDSGLSGKVAFFGYDRNSPSDIKEKKFYFSSQDGSIYCACLEAHDPAAWAQLESLLKTLQPRAIAQQDAAANP